MERAGAIARKIVEDGDGDGKFGDEILQNYVQAKGKEISIQLTLHC